jgi:hypothetical protein
MNPAKYLFSTFFKNPANSPKLATFTKLYAVGHEPADLDIPNVLLNEKK